MKRYFKRSWDESRGDDFDDWGPSTWLFEVDDEGHPIRQIEIYADGHVLTYDRAHLDDQYGGLGEQPLDADDFAPYEIVASEFEEAWSTASPINR